MVFRFAFSHNGYSESGAWSWRSSPPRKCTGHNAYGPFCCRLTSPLGDLLCDESDPPGASHQPNFKKSDLVQAVLLFNLQAGTSIAAGIEFAWATNTTLSVSPSTATWGDSLLLQATVSSLNPSLINVTTGSVVWTLNGVELGNVTVNGEPFLLT